MLTVQAPAKINLTLEVLGKRPDGYHNIRSVVQTVNCCDELRFEESESTVYRSNLPGWDGEKSLIAKTVGLLRQTTGTTANAAITVKKKITLSSGLGGDSSDAAAALKGLNLLWQLGLQETVLSDMAARLGSDVPFFIKGGTALMEGRGEKITSLPPLKKMWLILLIPDVSRPPRKTELMYGRLKPEHYTDGATTSRLMETIQTRREIETSLLFNTFENIAFEMSEELYYYRQHILKIGAANLHLAGSGPAMYTVVPDEATGKDLCTRLEKQGLKTYLTITCPPI